MSSLSRLLDFYPAPVRTLMADLATLIKSAAPGGEAVRPTRCLRYSHARCGYFCGLYPQDSSAQLLFEFGVLLPDPEGLLEGDGSHVRFVTVWANQPLRARRPCAAWWPLRTIYPVNGRISWRRWTE